VIFVNLSKEEPLTKLLNEQKSIAEVYKFVAEELVFEVKGFNDGIWKDKANKSTRRFLACRGFPEYPYIAVEIQKEEGMVVASTTRPLVLKFDVLPEIKMLRNSDGEAYAVQTSCDEMNAAYKAWIDKIRKEWIAYNKSLYGEEIDAELNNSPTAKELDIGVELPHMEGMWESRISLIIPFGAVEGFFDDTIDVQAKTEEQILDLISGDRERISAVIYDQVDARDVNFIPSNIQYAFVNTNI